MNDQRSILCAVKIVTNTIFETSIYDSATIYDPTKKSCRFGLHIANHSWGIKEGELNFTDSNITLLREAIHFANRLKVTVVAGRGNYGGYSQFLPATLDDDWVLCVSATDIDGNFASWSAYGLGVDVAAPGDSLLIRTTHKGDGYGLFFGTSAATPHVAGLAGLLMSYLNAPDHNAYQNLAPEDVEYIIQMTATDVGISGPDSLTGYGRINAGAAMEAVDTNYRSLRHYGTGSFSNDITVTPVSTNVTITIPELYENDDDSIFKAGKYIVDVYKVDATVYHNLSANDSIVWSWPRHSSSNLLPLFGGNYNLLPRERILLNSVNQSSTSLTGYVYKVYDSTGTTFKGWWPFDSATAADSAQFEYSILVHKLTGTEVEESAEANFNMLNYPNPTGGQQTLVVKTDNVRELDIRLYDVLGRMIRTVYTGISKPGDQRFNLDFHKLVSGIYILRICMGDDIRQLKVVKD